MFSKVTGAKKKLNTKVKGASNITATKTKARNNILRKVWEK